MTRPALLLLLAGCGSDADPAPATDTSAPEETEETDLPPVDTGDRVPDACEGLAFEVIVGQGNDTTFQTGAPGDELVIYYGPQGGWHVDAAATVAGVGPDTTVEIEWTLTVLDEGWVVGDPVGPFFTSLQPYDEAACDGNVYGLLAYLDHIEVVPGDDALVRGCALDGKPLRMELTVTLPDGRSAGGTVEGTAVVDEATRPSCPAT